VVKTIAKRRIDCLHCTHRVRCGRGGRCRAMNLVVESHDRFAAPVAKADKMRFISAPPSHPYETHSVTDDVGRLRMTMGDSR
jgi:hypothetical protein